MGAVLIYIRPWLNTDEFRAVKFDLLEAAKETLDQQGVSIPFPQREIHLYNQKDTKENIRLEPKSA